MRSALLFLLFFLVSLALSSQANIFKGDRFIPFHSHVQNRSHFSVLIKVQSLSTSVNSDKHEVFFSATNRDVELADYNGKLSFFDGKEWKISELDIRKERRNIIFTYSNSFYRIYQNDELVFSFIDKKGDPYFQSIAFYLGASYSGENFFHGVINQIAIYNTTLPKEDLTILKTSPHYINFFPYPVLNIDLEGGIIRFNGFGENIVRIENDIGLIYNKDSELNNYPHYDLLLGNRDLREKKQIFLSTKRHITLGINKSDQSNSFLEGDIQGGSDLLYEGEYNLTVLEDGTIKIVRAVLTDNN